MKKIIFAAIAAILLTGGYLAFRAYSGLTASSIVVSLDSAVIGSKRVVVDGEEVFPSGKDGATYTTEVSTGQRKIEISSSHYKEYSEIVDVKPDAIVTVKPKLIEKTADALARELRAPTNTTTLDAAKYFGDKTWVIFRTRTGNDVSVVAARYTPRNGKWGIVAEVQKNATEGSSLDSNKEVFQSAPNELLAYARGL